MDKNQSIQEQKGSITLGDDVFIDANSYVLYDALIGSYAIISWAA